MKNNYKLRKVSIKLIGAMALLTTLLATPIVNNATVSASSFHYQIKKNGYVYKNAHIKAIKSRSSKHYFGSHKLTVKKTIVVKRNGKRLIYKYVLASNGRNGWVNTKYVKNVKAAKHNKIVKGHKKTIKKSITITIPNTKKKTHTKDKPKLTLSHSYNHKKGQYVPNKENIKAEFKKLLDPYLAKYGKTYGTPIGKKYMAIVGDNNYGAEFVVTSGNIVSSDKEMAKTLFNGLLRGTLMNYLEDHSNVNVIIDHIDLDTSEGTIDARLYLTWYEDISIQPKFEILNGKPVYNY